MQLYKQYIFPHLLNLVMDRDAFREQRRRVLKDLQGVVLEIGFGTGLNLPFYPPTVRKIIALDPERFPNKPRPSNRGEAQKIEFLQASGEKLPLENNSIDHVVTTWTLCSVTDPAEVLREISRVLKPGGTYVFVEHGKSPEPLVGRLQDWLTPLQTRIGEGCHLNRKIDEIVSESPLQLERMETFYMPGPRIAAFLYLGSARKA